MPDEISVTARKKEIRSRMRERRRQVSPEDRKAAGKAACKQVIGEPIRLLLRAWRVSLYLSTSHEIPTRYLARAVWEEGRDVCVPAWCPENESYGLFALDPRMKVLTGHRGIREPAVRIPVLPWDVDAFVLPGLAFDALGGRLGFGAGYYDRILARASSRAPKIGLCYDWQILDEPLPQEPHDVALDWLVSERRVLHCAANRKATRTGSPS